MPIIDNKREIKENKELPDLFIKKGEINFSNVSFSYNEENKKSALNSINLKIDGGKTTALVGLSGAGKSTILSLIPKFYKIQSGLISIDGQSIDNINLFSLRKKFH